MNSSNITNFTKAMGMNATSVIVNDVNYAYIIIIIAYLLISIVSLGVLFVLCVCIIANLNMICRIIITCCCKCSCCDGDSSQFEKTKKTAVVGLPNTIVMTMV